MREINNIERDIAIVNHTLKSLSRSRHKKTMKNTLVKQRRHLIRELHETQVAISQLGFGIDNFSESVVSLSKHKSRYCRIGNRYYSDKNYLIATNQHGISYVYKTKYSQIQRVDLERFIHMIQQKEGNCLFYSDNRHKGLTTLPKRFTLHTERLISRIKTPIYPMLKDMQIKTIDELDAIYSKRFRELHISLLNY